MIPASLTIRTRASLVCRMLLEWQRRWGSLPWVCDCASTSPWVCKCATSLPASSQESTGVANAADRLVIFSGTSAAVFGKTPPICRPAFRLRCTVAHCQNFGADGPPKTCNVRMRPPFSMINRRPSVRPWREQHFHYPRHDRTMRPTASENACIRWIVGDQWVMSVYLSTLILLYSCANYPQRLPYLLCWTLRADWAITYI